MSEKQVREVMSRAVIRVTEQTSLREVVLLMEDAAATAVIVYRGTRAVGIITSHDVIVFLARCQNPFEYMKHQAVDVMSRQMVTVQQNAPLFEAIVLAQTRKISHLPVVDDQVAVVGMLNHHELMHSHRLLFELSAFGNTAVNGLEQARVVSSAERMLSLQDSVLDVGNRRAMEVDLRYSHAAAQRYGQKYALILLDMDRFGRFKRDFGVASGDKMLHKLVEFCHQTMRSSDRIYRYQNDSLLLFLPETESAGARILAERLVEGVSKLDFNSIPKASELPSASAGVVAFENLGQCHWQDLLAQAAFALQQAKQVGGAQVCLARECSRTSHQSSL